jgi:hypothetical protein
MPSLLSRLKSLKVNAREQIAQAGRTLQVE